LADEYDALHDENQALRDALRQLIVASHDVTASMTSRVDTMRRIAREALDA